ncbi:MAG: hypothetical protein ACXWQE_14095 [Bdellovibrionales bacterium]
MNIDLGRAAQIVIFFAVLAGAGGYFAYMLMNEGGPNPCSVTGYPGRCYVMNEKACNLVWEKSAATCKEAIQKYNLPPGRLVGPIIQRCQLGKIDEAFGPNRKSTPECEDMHRELEEWKQRNGF